MPNEWHKHTWSQSELAVSHQKRMPILHNEKERMDELTGTNMSWRTNSTSNLACIHVHIHTSIFTNRIRLSFHVIRRDFNHVWYSYNRRTITLHLCMIVWLYSHMFFSGLCSTHSVIILSLLMSFDPEWFTCILYMYIIIQQCIEIKPIIIFWGTQTK